MKFFIQARKDGYNVLYPSPTPEEFFKFANDIQSVSANNNAGYYGKNFYSLAFTSDGCIFSKYILGYDVSRSNLGNVGISIFIPNTEKLSGEKVKELLDRLLETFWSNYCTDNKISNKKEDWSLFTSIAEDYDKNLGTNSVNLSIYSDDLKEPAFHYYKSDNELISFLGKPFQEEYRNYKQIFFIDSNLQGTGNPLNVLKNSGDEVNPDLNNKYYSLSNYESNKGVTITINGKALSVRGNKNTIRENSKIKIEFTKPYHRKIVAIGSISDTTILKYLEINGESINVNYNAFKPEQEILTISLNVVKEKQEGIANGFEILLNNKVYISNKEVVFKGEDIGIKHTIRARIGDSYFSENMKIKPEDYRSRKLNLVLVEKRVIRVSAKNEENKPIPFFTFNIKNKDSYQCKGRSPLEIEFNGDEIDKEYEIEIYNNEKSYRYESVNFCPRKLGNEKVFTLEKSKEEPTLGSNDDNLHNKEEKPKLFFYKHKYIITSIVSVLVLGLGLWVLYSYLGKTQQPKVTPLTAQIINNYLEGDSLMLNKLSNYKEKWESQEQNNIIKSGGGIFEGIFGAKEISDSTKWKSDWKPTYESIDRGIKKRELINNKNIEELLKLRYSTEQQPFKNAIEKIDSDKYVEVVNQLGDVSEFTLTQIKDSIDAVLTRIEQESQKDARIKDADKKQKKKQKKIPQPKIKKSNKKTPEIVNYIKGNELDKDKLEEYKNTKDIDTKLKKSIQLCLDFWDLNGKGKKTYYSFKLKVDKDSNLNKSKLKAFIEKMCQEGENTSYKKMDKKKGLNK